jgi:hypothetical protein
VVNGRSGPAAAPDGSHPHRGLTVWHAISVCVGMVIGSGIFKSTPLAAAVNLPSDVSLLLLWVFGGAMSLAGALYSSLAYVRVGAMVGVAVLLAGVVLLAGLRIFAARRGIAVR